MEDENEEFYDALEDWGNESGKGETNQNDGRSCNDKEEVGVEGGGENRIESEESGREEEGRTQEEEVIDAEKKKYLIYDQDKGMLESILPTAKYDLLPSRDMIRSRQESGDGSGNDSDEEEGGGIIKRKTFSKIFRRKLNLSGSNQSHAYPSTSSPSMGYQQGVNDTIRISTFKKDSSEFGDLVSLQEISGCHTGPIWTLKFSHDGSYLATAGQDQRVVIWQIVGPKAETIEISPADGLSSSRDSKKSDDNTIQQKTLSDSVEYPIDPNITQINSTSSSSNDTSDSATPKSAAQEATTDDNDGDDGIDVASALPNLSISSNQQSEGGELSWSSRGVRSRGQKTMDDLEVQGRMRKPHRRASSDLTDLHNASRRKDRSATYGEYEHQLYLSSQEENTQEKSADPNLSNPRCTSLLSSIPFRVYEGHTADVIDLSWSKTDFLLSASIDKTVRLWHVTREDCLHAFHHTDIVTSVEFHPLKERYFLSGCFDKKLRLWNIPDGQVKQWAQTPEMVTASRFSPDGSKVIAGFYHGQVVFYHTEGMKYYTQIECRNRKGPLRRGRKVTGLEFLPHLSKGTDVNSSLGGSLSSSGLGSKDGTFPSFHASNSHPGTYDGGGTSGSGLQNTSTTNNTAVTWNSFSGTSNMNGSSTGVSAPPNHNPKQQLLVTTNDSRLRLYQVDEFMMSCKYKGLLNDSLQIRASFSEDGRYIICGSENGKVYIWNTVANDRFLPGSGIGRPDRNRSYESFQATKGDPGIATVAAFVPKSSIRKCCLKRDIGVEDSEQGPEDTLSSNSTTHSISNSTPAFHVSDSLFINGMLVVADYEGVLRIFCRQDLKQR